MYVVTVTSSLTFVVHIKQCQAYKPEMRLVRMSYEYLRLVLVVNVVL